MTETLKPTIMSIWDWIFAAGVVSWLDKNYDNSHDHNSDYDSHGYSSYDDDDDF